jgi:hypothetical protein
MVWYGEQSFIVKWSGILSPSFKVTNGVRQGGILSPMFFNLYIDDLSVALTAKSVGCCVNNVFINHLFYADDSVLLAPTPGALQELIDVCLDFANSNDMLYNPKKTKCMAIRIKSMCDVIFPDLYLNLQTVEWTTNINI